MTVYDFQAGTTSGKPAALSRFRGKTLLIVNTASNCELSVQYAGLEVLYNKFYKNGFEVLDFPCGQFGGIQHSTNEDIDSFCKAKFHTTFPRFAKVEVNGDKTHPLFAYLKNNSEDSSDIKWNFTKFLINKKGYAVKRYEPEIEPEAIALDIEQLIAEQSHNA